MGKQIDGCHLVYYKSSFDNSINFSSIQWMVYCSCVVLLQAHLTNLRQMLSPAPFSLVVFLTHSETLWTCVYNGFFIKEIVQMIGKSAVSFLSSNKNAFQ